MRRQSATERKPPGGSPQPPAAASAGGLLSLLRLRRTTVGVSLQGGSALLTGALAAAGFDFLMLDTLHAPLSQVGVVSQLSSAGDTGGGTPVLVRVAGPADRSGIQQATDQGAAGVVVPFARCAADVRAARATTLYPPRGDRSLFAPLRAHHRAGMVQAILGSDASLVVAVQFERAPADARSQGGDAQVAQGPAGAAATYLEGDRLHLRARAPPKVGVDTHEELRPRDLARRERHRRSDERPDPPIASPPQFHRSSPYRDLYTGGGWDGSR